MFCVLYTTFLQVQDSCYVLVVIYHGDDTKEDPSLDTKVDPSLDTYKGPSLHPHTTAPSYDNTLTR
ncbi:hypothetical protein K523DRAFT_191182, partial [Schizophyllum commune Tattone D]